MDNTVVVETLLSVSGLRLPPTSSPRSPAPTRDSGQRRLLYARSSPRRPSSCPPFPVVRCERVLTLAEVSRRSTAGERPASR